MRVSRWLELASVATLAAGIAHDVATPMNVILGYANLIETSASDDKQRQRAVVIAEQTRRVSDLVQTLLDISRPRERESVPIRLEEVIRHALQFFREKLAKRGIAVEPDFSDVPQIVGDPARLEQVLLNLFVNAADAMATGGTLRVVLEAPDAEHVEIQVADTGKGIEPEQLQRIFDPYYTTKDRGEGTGLGLFMCKRIIAEHGGTIEVTSVVGSGTRFCITLPVTPTSE